MSVIIRTDLPLELKLQSLGSAPSTKFPERNAVYWNRYVTIKQWIADRYYDSTAAGLALEGGRFTKHTITHVDDVIEMAGRLLGHNSGQVDAAFERHLEPYETYILLMAVLLHDAGNARKRKDHEKQAKAILQEMGDLPKLNQMEVRLIASIAEAHGGHNPDGDKDTIRFLIEDDVVELRGFKIHARRLAATLRFADELAENPDRADPQAIKKPYNPPYSAIHNLYCQAIDCNLDYAGRAVYLKYSVTCEQLNESFKLKKNSRKEMLFIDYIADRVLKCDLERRYCNRFLWPTQYEKIIVKVYLYDGDDKLVERIDLTMAELGYPAKDKSIKSQNARFDGELLRKEHGDGGQL